MVLWIICGFVLLAFIALGFASQGGFVGRDSPYEKFKERMENWRKKE